MNRRPCTAALAARSPLTEAGWLERPDGARHLTRRSPPQMAGEGRATADKQGTVREPGSWHSDLIRYPRVVPGTLRVRWHVYDTFSVAVRDR